MKFHFWGFDSLTWVISLSWLLFWLFFPGLCHRILIVTLSFSLSFLQPLSHSVQHLSGCHSIEKRTDRVFFFFSFFFCLSGLECQQLWWIYGLKNISLLTCLCRDFSFFFLIYRGFQLPRSWILQNSSFFLIFFFVYRILSLTKCFLFFFIFFFIFTNKRRDFFFVPCLFFFSPAHLIRTPSEKNDCIFL